MTYNDAEEASGSFEPEEYGYDPDEQARSVVREADRLLLHDAEVNARATLAWRVLQTTTGDFVSKRTVMTAAAIALMMPPSNPEGDRCEALAQHQSVPLALSCRLDAGHSGSHEHLVRWS